jgi:4-amino-4-deoxy-L-arabinose transferase-like glycosyltransferase
MGMKVFFSFIKNQRYSTQKCFLLLPVFGFIIHLLQAIFTEINADEAYYFLYGKYPAWGYFDHPPMVALLSCISAFFFKGNLGARFLTVLIQIPTLWLIWLQLDKKENKSTKDVLVFFIIAASMVMFAVCGFTATPDAPLLFFTA